VTLVLAPFQNRSEFGWFLTKKKLLGSAVEVGTHRADFAFDFLEHWPGRLLYCIDPYLSLPGYDAQAEDLKRLWKTDGNRQKDYEFAKERLSRFKPRYTFYRKTSEEAAHGFILNSLDFVYLDGDHRRDAVALDLRVWWPKVKPGGILAGHDFICPGEVKGGWGRDIQPAVTDFAHLHGLDINLVPEETGLPWSYYFVKEQPT